MSTPLSNILRHSRVTPRLLEHPLAADFDLRSGSVPITVPADTAAGDDYSIVCESRNSPQLTFEG